MLVDLLLTDNRYYTFEGMASHAVSEVLKQKRIACRRVVLQERLSDYWYQKSPQWTLSFTHLTPHQKPLCDVWQIPHFYWVEDSLELALHYLDSQYGKLGVPDRSLAARLSHPQAYYLPHGVESPSPKKVKKWDVVHFSDLTDKNFHILEALKGIPLHLFGEHIGADWLVRVPSSVKVHTSLPYIEQLEVLASASILLAEPGSRWYGAALAANCLPLLPEREPIEYYLAHPQEREEEIARLSVALPTWESQVEQVIEWMSSC